MVLCLTAFCMMAEAQTSLIPDMKFRRLDTPNGLSSSQVNNIFKDSKGYVWIGTKTPRDTCGLEHPMA